jgi:eukaryotic-like serine/threonine-protein kinase
VTTAAAWARVKELFADAVVLAAHERAAYLDDVCDDAAVRAEVEALLAHVVDAPLFHEAPPPPPPPRNDPLGLVGVALQGFVVERFVAEGGFSYVYRALAADGAPIAVKAFKRGSARVDVEELKAAFARESALLVELQKKATAVVRCVGAGAHEGLPYILLEWLQGRPLAYALRASRAPWALPDVVKLLRPVALALAAAHESGVAHRDLKPENLFLVDDDAGPRLKLLDFGIAKVAAGRTRGFRSTTGALAAFTLGYCAPEQASRSLGPSGPWTDVYAFALVCVEMLAGEKILPVLQAGAVAARVEDDARRPSPRALGVDVTDAVEAVFARALARDPDARFPSLFPFWAALESAAAG